MFSSEERNSNGPTVPVALSELAQTQTTGIHFYRLNGGETFVPFAELYRRMMTCAHNLRAMGLVRGDRLAIVIPEPEDFVSAFLGAMAAGIIPVPLYPPLSLGKLDAYVGTTSAVLERAGARALLCDSKLQRILWSLVDRVSTLERILVLEDTKRATQEDVVLEEVGLDDIAFLQFTSGSTAAPKGVIVTHRALVANMDAFMRAYEIRDGDVALSWLPLFHDLGLIGFVLATCWYGLPTVLMPTIDFVKHPAIWMQAMDQHKATITCAPNFAFALATRRTSQTVVETLDLSHVRMLGCGAEPTHPATIQHFLDHFAAAGIRPQSMVSVYGLAENVLGVTHSPMGEALRVDRVNRESYLTHKNAVPTDDEDALVFVSVGSPYPGFSVTIMDDHGNSLPDRQIGEIFIQGPSVAAGYFDDLQTSEAVFTKAGLRSGDLGYLDSGELFITGRKKDIVIVHGRNYDPQSIEWVVQEIEGVRKGNVVAFSVPNERTEELVIVCEVKGGAELVDLRRNILQAVREEVGLTVSEVVFLQSGELPKTSSGKLQRSRTREQFLNEELGRDGARTLGARAPSQVLAKHLASSAISRAKHAVRQTFLNR